MRQKRRSASLPPRKGRLDLRLVGIALLAIVLFANTVPNALVSDDAEMIAKNPATHHPFDVGSIFGGRYWGGIIQNDTLYRPLSTWTMALNYGVNRALGRPGETPAGFHLVNILLHAAASCLLYIFLRRLGIATWVAFASGLLFVALPIHTEAVASIVGRAEPLAASFGLLFLILHRDGRRWLAGLSLLLAALSKESAIAFIAVAIWLDFCLRSSSARKARADAVATGRPRTLATYGVYAGALAIWLAARTAVVASTKLVILKLDNPLVDASTIERILTAAGVQLRYLRLELLPIGLSSDYSYNQIPVGGAGAALRALGLVVVIVAAAVLGRRVRRAHPIVPFAAGAYAILFLPASNLVLPIGTIMGERLAYAPSLGLCALAGYGAWLARGRLGGAIATYGLAAVLIAYGAVDIARSATWRGWEPFARAQVRSAPNSAKAHYNAGLIEQQARRLDAAAADYQRALAIHPTYVEALNNLGIIKRDQGNPDEAIRLYRQALAILPTYPQSHFNLGQALHIKGNLGPAADEYRAAIALNPNYVQALTNLAAIYMGEGRLDDAEPFLERAVAADPSYAPARINLDRLRRSRSR